MQTRTDLASGKVESMAGRKVVPFPAHTLAQVGRLRGLVQSGSEYAVLSCLLFHISAETGECFVSPSTISEITGLSKSQTYRALVGLEGAKLIERTRRGRGKSSLIRLRTDRLFAFAGLTFDIAL